MANLANHKTLEFPLPRDFLDPTTAHVPGTPIPEERPENVAQLLKEARARLLHAESQAEHAENILKATETSLLRGGQETATPPDLSPPPTACLDGPAPPRNSTPLQKISHEHGRFVAFMGAGGLPGSFEHGVPVLRIC